MSMKGVVNQAKDEKSVYILTAVGLQPSALAWNVLVHQTTVVAVMRL